MRYIKLSLAALGTSLLLATAAIAQSGSGGVFTMHNQSGNNVVVGFYTNDGDGWSDNWLSEQLDPGTNASAEFTAETGSCDQTLQVGWLGADGSEVMDEPIAINICEATHVYLADNEIYFE